MIRILWIYFLPSDIWIALFILSILLFLISSFATWIFACSKWRCFLFDFKKSTLLFEKQVENTFLEKNNGKNSPKDKNKLMRCVRWKPTLWTQTRHDSKTLNTNTTNKDSSLFTILFVCTFHCNLTHFGFLF